MSFRFVALILSGLIAAAPCPGRTAESVPVAMYDTLLVRSATMGEKRRIHVYVPPGYERCRADRYPVLYMPDGGIAEDFPHMMSTVHRMIRRGAIRPILLVGIQNTVRRRDMTGPTQTPADLQVTDQPGGSERFRSFLSEELVPIIQARYRASDESAIIGESLAGLFIVETMFEAPGLFDTYIALDPSLWWNSEELIRKAPQRLPSIEGKPARLLIAAGSAESNAAQVEKFVAELARHAPGSLQWQYDANPDIGHGEIYRALKKPMLLEVFGADPDGSSGCWRVR